MPSSLETPVLQVDVHVIHKVDTSNPENLYSMWTVFARCADSVYQGRRLENLSWRLWNRETFCCKYDEELTAPSTAALPRAIQRPTKRSSSDSLPPLSGSVDSAVDEEAVEFVSDSAPFDIVHPRIQRQDSCTSTRSRGRERHISSDHLEKMVVSIIEAKELPFKATEVNSQPLASVPEVAKPCTPPALHRSGSTSTESMCDTTGTRSVESLPPMVTPETNTTVVRGFSPSSCSLPAVNLLAPKTSLTPQPSAITIPAPTDTPAPKTVPPKKQPAVFLVGGSSASGDDCPSEHGSNGSKMRTITIAPVKKSVFHVGGSSDDERSSPKSAMRASRQGPYLMPPKTVCSSRLPAARAFQSLRMPTETDQSETDYIDESAIDDDDDEDEWEDSVEESGKSMAEEKIHFKRVDSKMNLTSRRSLITLMLAQNERQQQLGGMASSSTSAIPRNRSMLSGPSLVASPNDSDDNHLTMKRAPRNPALRSITEVPRTMAQPIVTPAIGTQNNMALSPRTTRRNMLATELTESLRINLLWERSQKSQVAKAVLKRRHTSQDVANLKQYPERSCIKKENDVNASSWDDYFNKESFTGYHAQGW